MWRVSSGDRWVAWDGKTVTGDVGSVEAMTEGAGKSVALAPMSGLYRPTGQGDPLGLYLLARAILPGPLTVTGSPPAIPTPAGSYPADATF